MKKILVNQKSSALFLSLLLFITLINSILADDSFNSIGGYSLGQSCSDKEFTNYKTKIFNPNGDDDSIEVFSRIIEKKTNDGYDLKVKCGIIDNKVDNIMLSSESIDDIQVIQNALTKKMGHPADKKFKQTLDPKSIFGGLASILGNYVNNTDTETESWILSNNRYAIKFTISTIPYGGSTSMPSVGGIKLIVDDKIKNKSEWNYLKQNGIISSKQRDALIKDIKKQRTRDLLQ